LKSRIPRRGRFGWAKIFKYGGDMKLLKKILTIAFAFLMTFSLIGCNDTDGQGGRKPHYGLPGEKDEPFDTPISKFE
jgi:hypothetical protein